MAVAEPGGSSRGGGGDGGAMAGVRYSELDEDEDDPCGQPGPAVGAARPRKRARRVRRAACVALGVCVALGAAVGAWLACRELLLTARSRSAIVIGGGVSGLAAAATLGRAGWRVTLLEARGRLGGRVHSEVRLAPAGEGGAWTVEHGANWIHGGEDNPIWRLVHAAHPPLLSTQWLPRTYRVVGERSGAARVFDAAAGPPGAARPGFALRERYYAYAARRSNLTAYLAAMRDGRPAPVRDLPTGFWANAFVDSEAAAAAAAAAAGGVAPSAPPLPLAERLDAFEGLWSLADEGAEPSAVGGGTSVFREFERGKEWMAGREGMGAIVRALARRLRGTRVLTHLGARVVRLSRGRGGVVAAAADGRAWSASVAVLSVPLGVLQQRQGGAGVAFEPALPAWKVRAIWQYRVGHLEKVYLRWPNAWWEAHGGTQDALVPAPAPPALGALGLGRRGARLGWYNLRNLRAGYCAPAPARCARPAVLLATPAGVEARALDALDDAALEAALLASLGRLFPNATRPLPRPVEMVRTRWGVDPLARGSYSYVPLDADLHAPLQLAEPLGGRLYFAGEHTSTLRHGFVDGAYTSGRRAARRILDESTGSRPPRYSADEGAEQPPRAAELRALWAALAASVLPDELAPRAPDRGSEDAEEEEAAAEEEDDGGDGWSAWDSWDVGDDGR